MASSSSSVISASLNQARRTLRPPSSTGRGVISWLNCIKTHPQIGVPSRNPRFFRWRKASTGAACRQTDVFRRSRARGQTCVPNGQKCVRQTLSARSSNRKPRLLRFPPEFPAFPAYTPFCIGCCVSLPAIGALKNSKRARGIFLSNIKKLTKTLITIHYTLTLILKRDEYDCYRWQYERWCW